MPKKKSAKHSSHSGLAHFVEQHHLIPSVAGGGIAYILSGVVALGLIVFAAVWAGNMISHKIHKH